MSRLLTVIVHPAEDPDELDEMTYEDRIRRSGGWTKLELLFPGSPDVHAFGALDLDMGIYGAARAWDDETSCVEETAAIFHADLEERAAMLREHVRSPRR